MNDFSVQAAQIVEAVVNAADDIVRGTVYGKPAPPTPFQRAVIGGLVLIANAVREASPTSEQACQYFSTHEFRAAERAVAPFLDETPEGAK